jgi:phosphohistidine phosphatase SixA
MHVIIRYVFLAALTAFASSSTHAATQSVPQPRSPFASQWAMGPDWKPALEGKALLAALRGGGYVMYMRHATTDRSKEDHLPIHDFADCNAQRNLSEPGRAEARAIGERLRELKIPVEQVLASPYCRTMETARLVFGTATSSPAVLGNVELPQDPASYIELRQFLSTKPESATNLVLVGHVDAFYALMGVPIIEEAEIAVAEPLGASRFRVVARIAKEQWPALLALK